MVCAFVCKIRSTSNVDEKHLLYNNDNINMSTRKCEVVTSPSNKIMFSFKTKVHAYPCLQGIRLISIFENSCL